MVVNDIERELMFQLMLLWQSVVAGGRQEDSPTVLNWKTVVRRETQNVISSGDMYENN